MIKTIKSVKYYFYIAFLCLLLFGASQPAEAQIGPTTHLRITKIKGNNVTLSWNAAANANHYVILYRYPRNGSYYRGGEIYGTTAVAVLQGPGLTSWVVGATDANETEGGTASNVVSASPSQAPRSPSNNADPEDGPCPHCGASESGPAAGEPVNLASGAESYEPSPDITIYNPSGMPVSYVRNFRSDRTQAGQFSPGLSVGWNHNYDVSV